MLYSAILELDHDGADTESRSQLRYKLDVTCASAEVKLFAAVDADVGDREPSRDDERGRVMSSSDGLATLAAELAVERSHVQEPLCTLTVSGLSGAVEIRGRARGLFLKKMELADGRSGKGEDGIVEETSGNVSMKNKTV